MNAALPEQDGRGWSSLHVFIHDFSRLTHFIQTCLAGLPASLREHCFFVRYWLGGPHLRIRFRDAALLPTLEAAVSRYWEEHRFVAALDPELFYRGYASHLETEKERYWHANGSMHLIAYQPETARYGGPAGLALCEDEFISDSRVMLAMLRQEAPAQLEKILFGYCLIHGHILARHGLHRDYLRFTCGSAQADAVRRHVALRSAGKIPPLHASLLAQHDSVLRGAYFPEYLLPLGQRLGTLVARLADSGCTGIPAICTSLLHMSFNRAGVTPAKEANIRLFSFYVLNEAYQ
ncbi:lantibiotic dehydratase C-terminal domain-containing protein [Janthinobacterium agaricidamnosum]|uniref:Thiopeptide-type bacteriocin biosynthesis domain-containing protein n=1 Tax=Janthinobacterium agaricidamnosum NBRC 102515 = DSM 9628 TaxID=1349767 RepID=W0VEZ2_9BURK|nr:lantibiotic dehydratase C-terminal domain-containing protein [Janthinobacterium agaricidamnosum]CDG85922.1 hypothetical protein GJA_5326 [Janthinobacterium agaricidamnosum NBRC 102515 = DSM 9628]